MTLKPLADWKNFEALDIRAGRVVNVEDSQTKKPTYRLTIDFGPEIGSKVSCGAYKNYVNRLIPTPQGVNPAGRNALPARSAGRLRRFLAPRLGNANEYICISLDPTSPVRENLLNKTVVCVLNFGPKKMGPEISEVLVLGIANEAGETMYLTPESEVPLGGKVF